MNTNMLVSAFIEALKAGDFSDAEVEKMFERFGARKILDGFDVQVWSIALNWETKDVRFIEVDGAMGTILEVSPTIKVDVRTEYVAV